MAAMKLYSFKIEPDLAAGLKRLKIRLGVNESETIRRAIRAWLDEHGALDKAARKRAGTRKRA